MKEDKENEITVGISIFQPKENEIEILGEGKIQVPEHTIEKQHEKEDEGKVK